LLKIIEELKLYVYSVEGPVNIESERVWKKEVKVYLRYIQSSTRTSLLWIRQEFARYIFCTIFLILKKEITLWKVYMLSSFHPVFASSADQY
jgi:hypothetical protein